MKHKIVLACTIALLMMLLSAPPVSANPCEGRDNYCPLCTPCGCDWQPICVCPIWNPFCGRSACDPRHNPTGICTPCGEAWQPPCLLESPACDPGTVNTGVLCVPCGDPWHPPCPSEQPCDPGYSPLPAGFPVLCIPCGDTWYPECPTGDPCDPWHNPAVICTPCGGELAPLCWSGAPCKPGYEVEGWEFPLCTAKPAVGPEPDTGYLGPYDGLMPEQPEGEPLSGWVATHEHQFANLAYGGVTYWGEPFNEDGVSVALAECDYTDDPDLEIVLPSLWGEEDAADFMASWLVGILNYIPTEYPDVDLTFVRTGLENLAEMLLYPPGPAEDLYEDAWNKFLDILPWESAPDWLEALLNELVDGLQELLSALLEALLEVLPKDELLGPALVRGLSLDLAPWDPLPPVLGVVPRYGVHGDDPAVRPDSPSQFWLGLTQNMAVNSFPLPFHHGGGYPNFEGWPTYENGGHQQMYYKWLERAYQAGLRLLVNLPVNNEVICEMSFQQEGFGCEDMDAVDRQIEAIYALEAFIDKQNDGQLDGDGWYRVALSASEARQIIEDGAMAVIIGIEVDNLFGCKPDTNYCCEYGPVQDCQDQGYSSYEDFVDKKVQEYYDKGVRYMYPVHFWDNKFTGGAPYRDLFVYAQVLATGNCYEFYDCSKDGVKYHVGDDSALLTWFFEDLHVRLDKELCSEYGDYEAACNKKGLTPEGITLFNELIERDMLIDQDHLPVRSTWGYSDTLGGALYYVPGLLDIAEDKVNPKRGYKYPVISSHSAIRPNYEQTSEDGASFATARRIRDLGGVVSVPQPRDECSTSRDFVEGDETINTINELLFSIGPEHTATLEAGELSQDLWELFATNGHTLTEEYTGTVEVETVEPGQDWRITDRESPQGLRFRVQLDGGGGTLNVYLAAYKFSIGLEHTATLEDGELSQDLWELFATNGHTLTEEYTGTVEVETVEPGQDWRITDWRSPEGLRFRVQLDGGGGTLNVYLAAYKLGYVEHAEFMSMGLPEEHQDYPRIGLRSDFGAFLAQAGPRYKETVTGTLGYCDERDTVSNKLPYSFEPLMPDATGEFTRTKTGNQTWDYNFDGLAHVGLWPDLLADAKTLYETGEPTSTFSLDPVMHSAEAYLRMWEWIENCTPDQVPPDIGCPGTIITSGGVGGTTVAYEPPPAATDLCDWIPPDVHVLTTDPISGSLFETGVHTVTATATDFSGNASQCSFNVQMSCFQVNHARIGVQCMGLAELDLVYNGPDGAQVDVGDFGSFSVDDGDHILLEAADIGQEVLSVITQLQIDRERTTIPTACAAAIHIGDVFGPFTVQQLAWVFDDDAPPQKVEIKGTFRPAAPVDLTTVDVTYTIDDGQGDTLTYVIPAGSFQVEGKPSLQKFRYDSPKGAEPGIHARFDFGQYTFELSLDGVDTYGIAEADLTIGLQTGQGMERHYGLETVHLQITPRQLDYLAAPQWDCSP